MMFASVGLVTTTSFCPPYRNNPFINIPWESNNRVLSTTYETWDTNSNWRLEEAGYESLRAWILRERKISFSNGPPSYTFILLLPVRLFTQFLAGCTSLSQYFLMHAGFLVRTIIPYPGNSCISGKNLEHRIGDALPCTVVMTLFASLQETRTIAYLYAQLKRLEKGLYVLMSFHKECEFLLLIELVYL